MKALFSRTFVSFGLSMGLALGVGLAGTSWAQPEAKGAADASLEDIKKSITAGLQAGKPGIEVSSVEESPLPGLYKATIGNGPHVYATADGSHFIAGDIFKVASGQIVNLTEESRNDERAEAIAAIDKKDMIIFSPEGEVKERLYVFTDVDCGYCQLLHSKVAEYNDMGIEVRYLAYPRAGINSKSYKKIASAWCAKDPREALTKLKQREEIPENLCPDNPVASQFELARELGLSGTPALVLESGRLISGYVEPARLKGMLQL